MGLIQSKNGGCLTLTVKFYFLTFIGLALLLIFNPAFWNGVRKGLNAKSERQAVVLRDWDNHKTKLKTLYRQKKFSEAQGVLSAMKEARPEAFRTSDVELTRIAKQVEIAIAKEREAQEKEEARPGPQTRQDKISSCSKLGGMKPTAQTMQWWIDNHCDDLHR